MNMGCIIVADVWNNNEKISGIRLYHPLNIMWIAGNIFMG